MWPWQDRYVFLCFSFVFFASAWHALQGVFPALATSTVDRMSVWAYAVLWLLANVAAAVQARSAVRARKREIEEQSKHDTRGKAIAKPVSRGVAVCCGTTVRRRHRRGLKWSRAKTKLHGALTRLRSSRSTGVEPA